MLLHKLSNTDMLEEDGWVQKTDNPSWTAQLIVNKDINLDLEIMMEYCLLTSVDFTQLFS